MCSSSDQWNETICNIYLYKNNNKTLLCMLALIYNENRVTIETILKYLKLNFNFNPPVITIDFGEAGYSALKNIFPKTRIFPCYFHLIRRLILHIKDLLSENKVIKRASKNLLFNMKILFFIDNDKIDEFFELIKNKYYDSNKKFLDYFEKNYMEKRPYSDRKWNYFNFLKNNDDSNLYFFNKNVCESLNLTINIFYKFWRKTFMNYSLCIKKIISHY